MWWWRLILILFVAYMICMTCAIMPQRRYLMYILMRNKLLNYSLTCEWGFFNRFRAGIVPLAQIDGIMQILMQWKFKKRLLYYVCEGLVNFCYRCTRTPSQISQQPFFDFHVWYYIDCVIHSFQFQCKQHTEYIATFINHTMFGRHKAARGRQYFSKYYPKEYNTL